MTFGRRNFLSEGMLACSVMLERPSSTEWKRTYNDVPCSNETFNRPPFSDIQFSAYSSAVFDGLFHFLVCILPHVRVLDHDRFWPDIFQFKVECQI